MSDPAWIRITGARQHNLKDLTLALPKNKLVVITGVSGSGKSSLAFDTLYAEGQRRYVESLSAYARQFLERLGKPDVDSIEGLSPAIAIEQRTSAPNPRSTVATTTEIYDYLRVLWSSCGQPHDPDTGEEVHRKTVPQIAAELSALPEGTRLMLLAPVPPHEMGENGDTRALFTRLKKAGFVRVRIDGEITELESLADDESPRDRRPVPPRVEIVIDRLAVRPDGADRMIESIRTALRWSRDAVWALVEMGTRGSWREERFTTSFVNPRTGFRLPELTPKHFSFNSHHGACPVCQGLGTQMKADADLLVPDRKLSLAEGAVKSWWTGNPKMIAVQKQQLQALAAHFGAGLDVPFEKLPLDFQNALFHGTEQAVKTGWKTNATTKSLAKPFPGLLAAAERLHEASESESLRKNIARLMNPHPCPECHGRRLKREILAVTLRGGGVQPPTRGGAVPAPGDFTRIDPTDPTANVTKTHSGRLPHWRADGATFAITFRLADALPQHVWTEWKAERDALKAAAGTKSLSAAEKRRLDELTAEKVQAFLDAGHGSCLFNDGERAKIVADALRHFDRERYELFAWCVMPNHVHAVLQPKSNQPLSDILHSWKSFTAHALNKLSGTNEAIWQKESYDRVIRDEVEFGNQVRYVLENPAKAGLRDWAWVGSRFGEPGSRDGSTTGGRRDAAPTTAAPETALAIDRFTALTVSSAREWLGGLELTEQQRVIAAEPLKELAARLSFLHDVGLGYLTLDREMGTLSGGEAQRIRLATQIGSGLSGVLYVLDEPSIGLHQRDNERLIGTLHRLRDLGNTVIVVEHDEETMRAADWLVDFGPGAGPHGGEVLAAGTPDELMRDPKSLTGRYLSGELHVGAGKRRASLLTAHHLTIEGASEHNLRDVTVRFPVGLLTCVTGVSGSGKSTLVDDILRRALARYFYNAKEPPGRHRGIAGLDHFDKLVVVDQDPIGRSPRSNPVTYLGAFTEIRKLFAELPASKVRGFTPGTFSFNTSGGRCETCEGDGQIRIDMHFLTDVYVTCEACGGRRYQRDVLDVTYKGRSVADVLEMSFEEATTFFRAVPQVSEKLRTVCLTGLGYLKLGQPANTLSGGEAQRLKLSAELSKRATGRTLYLLDEPTTGLHFQDIEVLLGVLFRLRDAGNTLIVIEHNLDVVRAADWVIDLGPGGGENGGRLVAEGPPEQVAACAESETGRFLRRWWPGEGA